MFSRTFVIFFFSAIVVIGGGLFFTQKLSVHAGPTQARHERMSLSENDFTCTSDMCVSRSFSVSEYEFLALEWPITASVEVRLHTAVHGWERMQPKDAETDTPDGTDDSPYFLFPLEGADFFQIQSTREGVAGLTATLFVLPHLGATSDFRMAVNETPGQLAIVPRTQWLDTGIELSNTDRDRLWPSEYDEARKIIIHHTATTLKDFTNDGVIDSKDYRETVRSIYYYHSQVRQWGDIGYQYIIDPDGTIWEGRFGGDGVTGGHAWRDKGCPRFKTGNIGFNKGTIGIALLGDFSNQSPTPQAMEALSGIIAKKAWDFGIVINGSSFFNDAVYPNVLSHRDVDCTDCPGGQVYSTLASVRAAAQTRYDQYALTTTRVYQGEPTEIPGPIDIAPGKTEQEVIVRFRNTGTLPWRNYGEAKTYLASRVITQHLASLDTVHIAVAGAATSTIAAQQPSASSSTVMDQFGVAQLLSPNVLPGEVGTFKLKIKPQTDELSKQQTFVIAVGSKGWMPTSEFSIRVTNNGLDYAATFEKEKDTYEILDDTKTPLVMHFKNRGTKEWKKSDVVLRIVGDDDMVSRLRDSSWKKADGDFHFNETVVKPGALATFTLSVTSHELGLLTNSLILLNKGTRIAGSDYEKLTANVLPSYVATVATSTIPVSILTTARPAATITILNTGALPWKKAQLRAYGSTNKVRSPFYDATWLSASDVAHTGTVLPGQSVTFTMRLKPPQKIGTYTQSFYLMQGSRRMYLYDADMSVSELKYVITVKKPTPIPKAKKAPVVIKKIPPKK